MKAALLLTVLYFLLTGVTLSAQCPVVYSYDSGGNRTARTTNCPAGIALEPGVAAMEPGAAMLAPYGETTFDLTQVALYPNPSSTYFELQFTGTPPEDGQLILLDATGRQVLRQAMTNQTYAIDHLPAGTYRLVLQTADQQYGLSLIKADR